MSVGDPGYDPAKAGKTVGLSVVDRTSSQAAGTDIVLGSKITVVVYAGVGNDTIHSATRYPAVLHGEGGNDALRSGNANDTLCGGADRDYLSGGDGTDILSGGVATDFIRTGRHNDPYWAVNEFTLPHGVDTDGDDDNETTRIG